MALRGEDMHKPQDEESAESHADSALSSPRPVRGDEATRLPFVTADQMAEVDRRAVRDYGIGLIQMMELAGRNLAEQARCMLGGSVAGREIVVLCGVGNNGGGGMAAARNLHGWGANVRAVLVGSRSGLKPAPKRQWRILERVGPTSEEKASLDDVEPDLIVDAIFGYGFHGWPRGASANWIEWANSRACPILALDLPSGLEATTGTPTQATIRATVTLTLALPKTGLRAAHAGASEGEVYLADIGVPPELYREVGLDIGLPFESGPIIRLKDFGGDLAPGD